MTRSTRGAPRDAYIRQTKPHPKPLRVSLEDGSADLDNLHGHWPAANQDMAAALKFAGYDFQFDFGTSGQALQHGGALLPRHPPLALARLAQAVRFLF